MVWFGVDSTTRTPSQAAERCGIVTYRGPGAVWGYRIVCNGPNHNIALIGFGPLIRKRIGFRNMGPKYQLVFGPVVRIGSPVSGPWSGMSVHHVSEHDSKLHFEPAQWSETASTTATIRPDVWLVRIYGTVERMHPLLACVQCMPMHCRVRSQCDCGGG